MQTSASEKIRCCWTLTREECPRPSQRIRTSPNAPGSRRTKGLQVHGDPCSHVSLLTISSRAIGGYFFHGNKGCMSPFSFCCPFFILASFGKEFLLINLHIFSLSNANPLLYLIDLIIEHPFCCVEPHCVWHLPGNTFCERTSCFQIGSGSEIARKGRGPSFQIWPKTDENQGN